MAKASSTASTRPPTRHRQLKRRPHCPGNNSKAPTVTSTAVTRPVRDCPASTAVTITNNARPQSQPALPACLPWWSPSRKARCSSITPSGNIMARKPARWFELAKVPITPVNNEPKCRGPGDPSCARPSSACSKADAIQSRISMRSCSRVQLRPSAKQATMGRPASTDTRVASGVSEAGRQPGAAMPRLLSNPW